MASIFPASASVGQVFNSYTFDGTSWNIEGFDFNLDYLEESAASATYLDKISASTTYATKTELNNIDLSSASAAAVAAIVDSAPSTLNTLNELAAALGDDANYASTITTALGNKLDISTASSTYLTQVNASSTYLTQINASTIYATKTELNNIDLSSKQDYSVVLDTLGSSYISLGEGSGFLKYTRGFLGSSPTWSLDTTTYLTQTSASTTYATKASPTFTGTLSSPTINATTKYQKNGTDIASIAYADITVSAQAGENTYLLNLPAGVDMDNFVSITPKNGVNNYLMVTGVALGDWSGVQTSNQIRVRCFLGNGVHLDPFILRVYYRV
jgi:hypothetical protein